MKENFFFSFFLKENKSSKFRDLQSKPVTAVYFFVGIYQIKSINQFSQLNLFFPINHLEKLVKRVGIGMWEKQLLSRSSLLLNFIGIIRFAKQQ